VVGCNVVRPLTDKDPLQQYSYELHFESDAHIEINTLFAENLIIAMEFFDGLYLELHRDNTRHPNLIRLLDQDGEEELALYATHFDALAR
jgi:hypothetical protein